MTQNTKEFKRNRGQPRGYIQYPAVLKEIQAVVNSTPKTAGEIQQEVIKNLVEREGSSAVERGVSKDTIRKYLNKLTETGEVVARQVGKSGQLTVYTRGE